MSLIILQQTLTMLLLMAVGLVLAKIGMIDNEMSGRLGKLLVSCIIPCITVHSFMVPMTDSGLAMLGLSVLIGLASLAISMGISYILFARRQCELDFASALLQRWICRHTSGDRHNRRIRRLLYRPDDFLP